MRDKTSIKSIKGGHSSSQVILLARGKQNTQLVFSLTDGKFKSCRAAPIHTCAYTLTQSLFRLHMWSLYAHQDMLHLKVGLWFHQEEF